MNDFSAYLHEKGAYSIELLQNSFPGKGDFFMNISHIGDPTLICTVYLPLVASLNISQGITLLWTILFCEWTNMLLKWILAGDRPFWWVHEYPLFKNGESPSLEQFPSTCETGPGMPSGHSTLNAAVFLVLIKAILKSHYFRSFHHVLKPFLWTTYVIWISLVVLSRSYIAAHFPHQCITGVLIADWACDLTGILTAHFVGQLNISSNMTFKRAILFSAVTIGSVQIVFFSYKLSGGDPMWSLSKAVKWCVNTSYIHIDTKPFYALSRFSGLTLGLGLALASDFYKKSLHFRSTTTSAVVLATASLITGKLAGMTHSKLPSTMTGYYLVEYCLNALYAFTIIALLPSYITSLFGARNKKQM